MRENSIKGLNEDKVYGISIFVLLIGIYVKVRFFFFKDWEIRFNF